MSIEGKTALITAAASGIGRAIAHCFAREGAHLVLGDIDREALDRTAGELAAWGVRVVALDCDVANLEDLDRLFAAAREGFGGLDILVNNAGIAGPTKPITEITPEQWDETMAINLRSQFFAIQKAVPLMRKRGKGKIVNLSSQSGKNPLPNRAPYCASKMGVIGLTRVAAAELGPYDITVNAICPGLVEGPRMDALFENLSRVKGEPAQVLRQRRLEQSPLRRAIPVEEIARLALFLSDDAQSNNITGEDVNITAGLVMF